jgi:hypothetical protein
VDLVFVDDAQQDHPSRAGMGPLVAAGAIYVPSSGVNFLERGLDALCAETGFPPGERFKWSPNRGMWMWGNLVEDAREQFFLRALGLAAQAGAVAIVVIEDRERRTATNAATHEEDVVTLLIERINGVLQTHNSEGVVICDRPGGDRPEENAFLASCLETLQLGTTYVRPDRIPINVVSTDSRLIRLLQLADVVTSCTLALVCGESVYHHGYSPQSVRYFAGTVPATPEASGSRSIPTSTTSICITGCLARLSIGEATSGSRYPRRAGPTPSLRIGRNRAATEARTRSRSR